MIDIPSPPPAWDAPYTGPGVVVELPLPRVNLVCRALGVVVEPGRQIYSCAMWTAGGCLEVLPKVVGPITREDQDKARRYEDANCNGWPKGDRE